ncbi:epimerase [Persicobacter psychrovividus]|uniref:Epimerase n=1 Tax=Persicobacter psychrovividus TaxID=387638 RepID=A0ABM7VE32_9BACT|nr:epimerase [Persicobacter psychrovividus]
MKVIITGSTGMVGKGALLECIDDPRVEKILLINRSSIDIRNPKVEEVLLKDFSDFSPIQSQMQGYDLCIHCMGVSAAGLSEEKYTQLTFGVTQSLASTLHEINPDMVFYYVSGQGTDSTENGKVMWARVKGRAENRVFQIGFKDAYAFRPSMIIPERGIKSRTGWYNAIYFVMRPFFPLMKKSKAVTTTQRIGQAMITLYFNPRTNKYLSGEDINAFAGND